MKKIKISISKKLYEIIEKKIKDTEFKNIEEYIENCLKKDLKIQEDFNLGKDEEKKIKEHLKSLGYLE